MTKLSDLGIRSLVNAMNPIAKSDGGGLTFTLTKAGRASWVLRYRHAGKAKEKTLGHYPDLTLSEARKLAAEDRVRISQGIDVAAEKQRTKREAASAWTVRELADNYLQKAEGWLEVSTLNGKRQYLRDYIYPLIGNLTAKDVTPSDIVIVAERASNKSLHVARLVLILLRSVFAHGLVRHVIQFNPALQVSAKSVLGPRPVARNRVMLSEADLKITLPLLHKMGIENELMAKILLATAARIGELVGARWENVDFEKSVWVIPATDIKGKKVKARNGAVIKSFIIPLTSQTLGWFLQLKDLAFGSDYVLPIRSRKKAVGDTHMEPVTLNAAFNKLWKEHLGEQCPRFTPHDLRSTARSHLGRLGVNLLIAERCLNHSLGELVDIYDQHDYLDQRREALEKWSNLIAFLEHGALSKNSDIAEAVGTSA